MRISTIAFSNLKRRKGKAAFLVIGIAIGIGTAVALLSLSTSLKEEIGVQMDQFGANIVIVPRSNSLALDYGGISVSGVSFDVNQLKNSDASVITDIPYGNRLSIIAPKILGAVSVENQEALLVGVDFDSEIQLKRWWNLVGEKPHAESEVVLGHEVARALSLIEVVAGSDHVHTPGMDMSEMIHQPGYQFYIKKNGLRLGGIEHKVTGVLHPTGGREDNMVFGSLSHVQELLKRPDQLSLIEVSALCTNCPVEDIVAQISDKLPHAKVSAIQQSVKARIDTVERLTRFSGVVSGVVLAIGALMIFTTMMGSVLERNREFGVLRALGFRRQHIVTELMIEVTVISCLGGLLGWAAGIAASRIALPYFAETGIGIKIDPLLGALSLGAAIVIGLLSSFYPVMRASRLDPSEAVRAI